MSEKIIGFVLTSGETIIGQLDLNLFDSFPSGCYLIENPAQVALQPMGNERMGIALIPFLPYSEGPIEFPISAMAARFTPNDQLSNEYRRLFGSGIEIASANVIQQLHS